MDINIENFRDENFLGRLSFLNLFLDVEEEFDDSEQTRRQFGTCLCMGINFGFFWTYFYVIRKSSWGNQNLFYVKDFEILFWHLAIL